MRNALGLAKDHGIYPEEYYRYNTQTEIPKEAYDVAENYKITRYAYIHTIEEMKIEIMNHGPCLIVFPVWNKRRPDMWNKNPGDVQSGYHCMSVVGWDDKGFIIRNSWGKLWGDMGYCHYPEKDWGKHVEAWIAIDANSKANHRDNELKPKKTTLSNLLASCFGKGTD